MLRGFAALTCTVSKELTRCKRMECNYIFLKWVEWFDIAGLVRRTNSNGLNSKNCVDDDARIFKTYVQMLIIFGIVVVGRWLVLAKAEVATATTAAATVTTSDDTANDETGLQTNRRESYCGSRWENVKKFTLQAGDVTTKYAFTFSSPNCSAIYRPREP